MSGPLATIVERRWGARRLLLFCTWVALGTNALGALLIWLWPAGLAAAFGDAMAPLNGVSALADGLITVWCLMMGRNRIALLNIEANKLVWVLAVISVLDFTLNGRIAGLMSGAAIGLALLLISGLWRPRLLIDRVQLYFLERRVRRPRLQPRSKTTAAGTMGIGMIGVKCPISRSCR